MNIMDFPMGGRPMPIYVGLTEENVVKKIKEDGFFTCHISSKDGIQYPFSASLSPGRVTLDIVNDIVVKANNG